MLSTIKRWFFGIVAGLGAFAWIMWERAKGQRDKAKRQRDVARANTETQRSVREAEQRVYKALEESRRKNEADRKRRNEKPDEFSGDFDVSRMRDDP